ncbi:MAG: Uma2 family endonuclease [Vicinamibacterales bacterium]
MRGVPELVVEISSPSTRTRDETIKLRLYERAGVLEYWVADTDADVVRVYRREGDGFNAPLELSRASGSVLATPLLPDLRVTLDTVFCD